MAAHTGSLDSFPNECDDLGHLYWPWQLLPCDRHTQHVSGLDSYLNECDELGSLSHLNGLNPIYEEEMDSETEHMTAYQEDQAWVPTT
jgi:hypothetical protein